jgi:hypothetical protein
LRQIPRRTGDLPFFVGDRVDFCEARGRFPSHALNDALSVPDITIPSAIPATMTSIAPRLADFVDASCD